METSKPSFLLAFDCGSTNFKAALYAPDGRRLGEYAEPVCYTLKDGTRFEMDPEETWDTALRTLQGVCRATKISPAKISGISFSSQAQTFTLCDDAGRAFMPLLSWLDKRAVDESAELSQQLGKGFHRHCTIPSPVPQIQLAKVLWARRHLPEAFAPGRHVTSLPGFLALRLAGINAMDRNLAALSGLSSLKTGGWWAEALDAAGVDVSLMPELVETGQPLPARRIHPGFPLAPGTPLVFAGNDQTCGAMGNDCEPGEWLVTLGTALVVYRRTGETPGPYHPSSLWGPWPRGGFYELATRDEGCAAIDWARGQLMPGAQPDDFAAQASRGDAASAPFFFPSAIHGPKAWSDRAALPEMARSVYEGVIFSLRDLVFANMEAAENLERLCAIGGGSRPDFRLQIMADALDRPVRRGSGDALDGAARLVLGRLAPQDAAEDRRWTPTPDGVRLCRERHAHWRELSRHVQL
ncbi:MAG: xylulokinase [Verrucomicrobiia bacterium]